MNNRSCQLALIAATICLTGCAMCANPFDCQYAAYGSRLPRADMTHGRVGSILDGSSGGIVTTEPIAQEGPIGDGEFIYDGSDNQGQVYNPDGVVYGDLPALQDSSPPLYQSPSNQAGDDSFGEIPAADQIERTFEAIEGEIRAEN